MKYMCLEKFERLSSSKKLFKLNIASKNDALL